MAASHRNVEYVIAINTGWADPEDSEKQMQWTRDQGPSIGRFSSGGAHVDFLGDDDPGDRVWAAYGSKSERLALLKSKYDPQNLFRMTKNIRPEC